MAMNRLDMVNGRYDLPKKGAKRYCIRLIVERTQKEREKSFDDGVKN